MIFIKKGIILFIASNFQDRIVQVDLHNKVFIIKNLKILKKIQIQAKV
jgi:hypothetical protein